VICVQVTETADDGLATARLWIPDAVAVTLQPASTVAVTPKDAVEVAANARVGIDAAIEINKPNANGGEFHCRSPALPLLKGLPTICYRQFLVELKG
jgi:hypothetical protein